MKFVQFTSVYLVIWFIMMYSLEGRTLHGEKAWSHLSELFEVDWFYIGSSKR